VIYDLVPFNNAELLKAGKRSGQHKNEIAAVIVEPESRPTRVSISKGKTSVHPAREECKQNDALLEF